MVERTHPVRGLIQGLGGLGIFGVSVDPFWDSLGKLGNEVFVQTGLTTRNVIADFFTSIDQSKFTFLNEMPIGIKVAWTLGILAGSLITGGLGFNIANRGYRNVAAWHREQPQV